MLLIFYFISIFCKNYFISDSNLWTMHYSTLNKIIYQRENFDMPAKSKNLHLTLWKRIVKLGYFTWRWKYFQTEKSQAFRCCKRIAECRLPSTWNSATCFILMMLTWHDSLPWVKMIKNTSIVLQIGWIFLDQWKWSSALWHTALSLPLKYWSQVLG